MDPNDADPDELVAELANEILAVVDPPGELESWAKVRLDGSIDSASLDKACIQLAEQFLTSDPPRMGSWEHLLVSLAFQSSRTPQLHGLSACKSLLRHLRDLLSEERPDHFFTPKLMIFASAMTVVLAIQYRLTQDIETAVCQLCDRFPNELPKIADQCQDIWQRRGQMTGRRGLFLWDNRQQEWRLAQDFTPHQPTA